MTATLSITILANATAAKKAFAETSDGAEDLGKTTSGMGKAIAAEAAAGVAGLVALGVGAFNAAEESAKIGRETERVIRTTGAAAWTSADQVSALAGAISDKSGADDEAIQSGANLLLTFTNVQNVAGEGNDVFDQATQAALDMSTALGTDMSSSAIQLGKALNDPIKGITALTKSGVSFTEQQRAQITAMVESGDVLGAQKIILGELQREFGGAAEAAGTPLDKLKTQVGNLQEELGAKLIPVVSTAATLIGDNMGPAIGKATEFLSEHSEAVKFLASVGLAGLALAYGPVVAGQVAMVATNVAVYAAGVAAAVVSMGEAFLVTAAAEGVLAATTKGLSAVLSASLPGIALLAAGGAIYAFISALDQSSEAADQFLESVTAPVDMSNFGEISKSHDQVKTHMDELRGSIEAQKGTWAGVAGSVADILIPFHDIENSLNDQQDEYHTLSEAEQKRVDSVNANTAALSKYAEANVLAASGVELTTHASLANINAVSDLNPQIKGLESSLLSIAQAKGIDLASADAVQRVQAIYEKTLFATESTLGMSEAQEKYNDAAATAKDKTDAYKLSLDALTGAHLGAAQAETAYSQNSLTLLGKLNENRAVANGLLDANQATTLAQTAAVNENNAAIQGNVKSAIDLANAKYAETGSIDEATASLATNREALINTMVQTGYTREAAEAYIDRLGLTPAAIDTQVNLDNAAANQRLAGTQGQLDGVAQGATGSVAAETAVANQKLSETQGQLNGVAQGANATVNMDTGPAERELSGFEKILTNFRNDFGAGIKVLFGGEGRAAGGPVRSGGLYVVGERGPELFAPGISGRIIPASNTATGTGSGGGTVNHFHITIPHTGLGADSPAIQRDVVDAIRRYETRNGPVRKAG